MISFIYNSFGILMFVWYGGYRWAILGNELGKQLATEVFKLNWWFAPINMLTSFLSIIFIIPTLFNKRLSRFLYYIAIFLLFRNLFYTIEDIIDYPSNHALQLFYIAIDLMMAIYTAMYLVKYWQSRN